MVASARPGWSGETLSTNSGRRDIVGNTLSWHRCHSTSCLRDLSFDPERSLVHDLEGLKFTTPHFLVCLKRQPPRTGKAGSFPE